MRRVTGSARLRRLAWFVTLWLAGVVGLAAVAGLLRWLLPG